MNDRTCDDCGARIPSEMPSCARCLLQLGIAPPPWNPDPSPGPSHAERTDAPSWLKRAPEQEKG